MGHAAVTVPCSLLPCPAIAPATYLFWMGSKCAIKASVNSGLNPPQLSPSTSFATSSLLLPVDSWYSVSRFVASGLLSQPTVGLSSDLARLICKDR